MKYLKMKWLDVVLIALLVLASFIPNAVFAYQTMRAPAAPKEKKVAVIRVDAKEVRRIELTGNTKTYDVPIATSAGENVLRVERETVKMIRADCPDQVCVTSFPTISQKGEQIICLPHKLIVEIEGGSSGEGDLNAH
ncbi:hypothetical protein ABB02_01236 [Clostridiaceae bacterium JG1575]|nr:hypothetical protein ABB02_01236 [Clostridiaceae bacterium JG1575]